MTRDELIEKLKEMPNLPVIHYDQDWCNDVQITYVSITKTNAVDPNDDTIDPIWEGIQSEYILLE